MKLKDLRNCILCVSRVWSLSGPYYLKEIFQMAPHCKIDIRNKFAKLKIPCRKTNLGQKAISFVGPSLWNSLPEFIQKQII